MTDKMKKVVYAELYPGTLAKWFVLLECGHFGVQNKKRGNRPQRARCYDCGKDGDGTNTARELFESHRELSRFLWSVSTTIQSQEMKYSHHALSRRWL